MTAPTKGTRLFTVRLWQEMVGEEPTAIRWRGKVQALPEGDAYYFRDWPELIALLQAMLVSSPTESSDSKPMEGEQR